MRGSRILGIPIGGTGDEDDDWFFTYFQPYRYIINRIPVYPSIGNHDAEETEERDDRAQVEDNFYIRERILGEEAAGRASFCPGLFYKFRYGSDIEFVCIDTSKEEYFRGKRLFEYPKHWEFIDQSFPADGRRRAMAHPVRAPSPVQRGAAASQHEGHGAPGAAVRARRRAGDVHRPRAQLPALASRRASTTS